MALTTPEHMQLKAFVGALAIVVAGLGASAAAQSRWGGSITVYNDVNYQGESTTFSGDMPNLVQNGWNDRISSIQIPDGQAWEVCVDVNFANRCQVLTSSVPDLRSMGLNDQISSIRRVDSRGFGYRDRVYGTSGSYGGNATGVHVFTNPNFRGQDMVLTGDTADLRQYNLNDRVRSIQVPYGETWEVCQDIDYGGACQTLTGNVADLRAMGWSDRMSSLRRIPSGSFRNDQNGGYYGNQGNYGNQQGLVFFDREGFQGRSQFIPLGSSRSGFSGWGGSLQVRGGGAWEVCDVYGDCATVTRDVPDVYDLGLSGPIASVRSLNNSGFRRFFRRF